MSKIKISKFKIVLLDKTKKLKELYKKWFVSDISFIKRRYKKVFNREIDLKNPKTFNEKLQWLKLNDRNQLYTQLVDKYEVRNYIAENIGEKYLIPLLGVWDKFEDIDFSKLPKQFVLKCTHDSGGLIICNDKDKLDIEEAREKINKSLKENYYYHSREWPYKNVKPRIICEELLKTKDGNLPSDYKFHCFNGVSDNVMVCIERSSGNPRFYFFDEKWDLLRYNIAGKNAPNEFTLPKPNKIDEMFEISRRLSKNIPFVRVDLYFENDKIYFGEMTFFPQSGFDSNLLESTDLLFGSKIKINETKKNF